MTIGERIKERRKELKMSQRDLAAKMGYSNHSTLTRIESGKVDVSQTRIVQFAEVLNTSIAYLMDWEYEENPEELADYTATLIKNSALKNMISDFLTLDETEQELVRNLIEKLKKS